MNILLINPSSPFLIDSAVFPPLGLLYLTSILKSYGHEVTISDMALGESPLNHHPDFIGISCLTPHIYGLEPLIQQLRGVYSEVPIILGGAHFTNVPQDRLKFDVNATCVGDGEIPILDFIGGHRDLLVSSNVQTVNWYPKPDRSAIDLHKYHYFINGLPATSLITARGCPFSCSYCSRGPGYDSYRPVALTHIEQELFDIRDLGFKAIMIYDDEINISEKRLLLLCNLLSLYQLKWRAFVRSDLFNENQARMMAESGCVEVCCGVESGNDQILKTVNKQATVADATRAVKLAKEFGMRIKTFCIIGLPGETEATAMDTKNWLIENQPDDFDICPFTPYPGSEIYKYPKRYDIKIESTYMDKPFYHKGRSGQYNVSVSTSELSAQRIAELRDEIEFELKGSR